MKKDERKYLKMVRKLTYFLKKTDGSYCWTGNKGVQRYFHGGFRKYMIPYLYLDAGFEKVFDAENNRVLLRVAEQDRYFDRWANSDVGYYYLSLKSLKAFQADFNRHKEQWKKYECHDEYFDVWKETKQEIFS